MHTHTLHNGNYNLSRVNWPFFPAGKRGGGGGMQIFVSCALFRFFFSVLSHFSSRAEKNKGSFYLE